MEIQIMDLGYVAFLFCVFIFICSVTLGCSYFIITDLIDTVKARRIKRNRLRALAYKLKKLEK
jgi:CHASE3 domain sensor protein